LGDILRAREPVRHRVRRAGLAKPIRGVVRPLHSTRRTVAPTSPTLRLSGP
jgi:hypothetical protein